MINKNLKITSINYFLKQKENIIIQHYKTLLFNKTQVNRQDILSDDNLFVVLYN